jgi:hypothetical protein
MTFTYSAKQYSLLAVRGGATKTIALPAMIR